MTQIYVVAKRDAGYNATRFLQMISNGGGVETAHKLLNGPDVSDGFTALWSAHRLDLTVEAHVLRPEYAPLFSDQERSVARQRLTAHGWQEKASP